MEEIKFAQVKITEGFLNYKVGEHIVEEGKETEKVVEKIEFVAPSMLKVFVSDGKVMRFVNCPMYFE